MDRLTLVLVGLAIGFLAGLGVSMLSGESWENVTAERDQARSELVDAQDQIGQLNRKVETLEPKLEDLLDKYADAALGRLRALAFIGILNAVEMEYRRKDGTIADDRVRLVHYKEPDKNDWLVVNQFTVIEGQHNRRPDVVVFANGMPLCVIELKNAADEDATIWTAFKQLQTYKQEIPSLFVYNETLIVSDGLQARMGSLTANTEWFKPWRTIEGDSEAPPTVLELGVLIRGVFQKDRFLKLLRHFIVFEHDTDSDQLIKIIAGYHQFHAVGQAIGATIEATSPGGDKRCGVVWHTQGSGKSLSMLFYAGEVILHPAMENPTLVCLTDRNDLDDQLFGQFARCSELLRQSPVQAESAAHLRELLQVASGGVVFTTIQKFLPDEKGGRVPTARMTSSRTTCPTPRGSRTTPPLGSSISTGDALSVIGTNAASPDSAFSQAAFWATIDSGTPSLS